MRERRQALRQRAEHRHARARRQIERADDDGRADHGDQDARHALAALEQQDHRQRRRRRPRSASSWRRPSSTAVPIAHKSAQRTVAVDREAEQLGQLADQHRQRDAVHVAVADRLGQQLGDEAQPRHAGQDAHAARHDRHHAGQRDGAHRIAAGQRQHDGEDHARPATSPARAPGCGWDRTARRPAAERSSRTGRRCPARPTPPRRRCRPAPASSSAPGRPRYRGAARPTRSCAASAGRAASAASPPGRRRDSGVRCGRVPGLGRAAKERDRSRAGTDRETRGHSSTGSMRGQARWAGVGDACNSGHGTVR